MQHIKLKIVDWWEEPTLENFDSNYFVKILRKKYHVEYSDNPDYILYSILGNEHLQYDCVRIFHTQENIAPDFNIADYALCSDYIDFLDRYTRMPHFVFDYYHEDLHLSMKKHEISTQEIESKQKFCSFLVSNPYGEGMRDYFFEELCKYKKVDSGGRWKNNIGGGIDSIYSHCKVPFRDFPRLKREFISQYKFHLCFENISSPGYITEKLFTAFGAKTVPIYWGDSSISPHSPYFSDKPKSNGQGEYIINPKAYINVHNFSSLQEAIEYIIEVDNSPKLFANILQEKVFLQDYDIIAYYENKILGFFDSIFAKDKESLKNNTIAHSANQAKKCVGFHLRDYEYARKDYAHIYEWRERFNSFIPRPVRPLFFFNKYHYRYRKKS
ncbi:glycosyltransferase family 10 domain-containing protein [Helicobacter sp. MIT 14-3879]|uniref:glycosyltransferase family 10 domain-containing protein n=1 Tax=Helicobacter sp. MIT 14-3879 TaxID=2040649 RepID=UPI000E1F01D0|nr:glycosyltransferase family 10 [Helicobacter sp. MIT 14-3879]RDU61459.1 alpha-1,3-fucosyltransferase [Helicobacter sp. MIT 14-3879]